ncbi:MAG: TIGR04372 family glycosyltransferase, partial [Rhodospirillaceae bacterium]|nr:TIGR04372 family glycosyltransferase [Rhodospirillaceae bacterium]
LDCFANLRLLRGEFEEAAGVYQTACKACPEVSDFSYRLGDALFRLGRLDEASATYQQVIAAQTEKARANPRNEDGKVVRFLGPSKVIMRYFGEMAGRLDYFIKTRRLNPVDDEETILLAPTDEVVNPCLVDYFSEHLRIVSNADEIDDLLARYPNAWFDTNYLTIPDGRTLHRNIALSAVQAEWERRGLDAVLKLKPDHIARGRKRLAEAGVAEDAWFACLHVRETGYFDEETSWSRNRYRNGRIEDYIPAIEAITAAGGWVIRIGDASMTPLPPMERVIDYANSDDLKSDWMDIFLIGGGRFLFGSASGPQGVAPAFGVPVLGTNYFPMGTVPPSRHDMAIHKLLRSKQNGRIIDIASTVHAPRLLTMEPLYFENEGLEVVDNTADEIREAVIEMLARLDGHITDTPEDSERQRDYLKRLDPCEVDLTVRISRFFLDSHPELFEDS